LLFGPRERFSIGSGMMAAWATNEKQTTHPHDEEKERKPTPKMGASPPAST
jgi:hypothetical protein